MGQATEIIAIVKGTGLPVAIGIVSALLHEATLVEEAIHGAFLDPPPNRLIWDRACDSDGLDSRFWMERRIDMI